jgi:tRNA pseudouridine55 synthase
MGFTSFDVVAKLRGMCKTRKIGHSGTLDPMATGVLPVFIGAAAKAVDMQQNTDKAYRAVMRLGVRTDTGDITGAVLEAADVPPSIDEAQVAQVAARFVGEQMQLPPMYSAVKINGQPLYKAARRGETVERKPRPIVVYDIQLLGRPAPNEYILQVRCGKGTYIRTLIEDIGSALGVPATLAALRRTQAGPYSQEQAHTLQEVQQACDAGALPALLLGVDTVFSHLNELHVAESAVPRLLNGAPVYRVDAPSDAYRLVAPQGFLGIGNVQDGVLQAQKLFVERG